MPSAPSPFSYLFGTLVMREYPFSIMLSQGECWEANRFPAGGSYAGSAPC